MKLSDGHPLWKDFKTPFLLFTFTIFGIHDYPDPFTFISFI